MTNLPERIYAKTLRGSEGPGCVWVASHEQADDDAEEYVRVDLVDVLSERIEHLERLEKAILTATRYACIQRDNGLPGMVD